MTGLEVVNWSHAGRFAYIIQRLLIETLIDFFFQPKPLRN